MVFDSAPNQVGPRRRSRRVAGVAAVLVGLLGAFASTAGASGTAWTGSGTASYSVVQDGTSGVAQFQYSTASSGSWTFSTTSDTTGTVDLGYTYTGYHAWFEVQVGLDAFVTSGGVTTTVPLVHDGPVDCCAAPSGGFAYIGTVRLHLHVGDTYGFQLSGSNLDADPTVEGTLTVSGRPRGANHVGYCSAAGDTYVSGDPIPVGTFLELEYDQPALDPHYSGAVPAVYVEGEGITCDPPPAGYVLAGFAGTAQHVPDGFYPYYVSKT